MFSRLLLLKCLCAVIFPSSPEIMRKLRKYVTPENDAASLYKHLSRVCARTQEPKSQRKEFEQAKANIETEESVGLLVLRIEEVLGSVPSPYVGYHEWGIPQFYQVQPHNLVQYVKIDNWLCRTVRPFIWTQYFQARSHSRNVNVCFAAMKWLFV
jgi:hypothetical protein